MVTPFAVFMHLLPLLIYFVALGFLYRNIKRDRDAKTARQIVFTFAAFGFAFYSLLDVFMRHHVHFS